MAWWEAFLRERLPKTAGDRGGRVRVFDAFCSVGGLSLGAMVAGAHVGRKVSFEAAADTDVEALQVFDQNFGPRNLLHESVRDLVDFQITQVADRGRSRFRYAAMTALASDIGEVDLLIGGPPCQGHSTLNNRTRSDDPKNQLFLTMPAIAVALDVPAVVIENVPNVVNDSKQVVRIARELFEGHGYQVEERVVNAHELGWPQRRRRFFMVARLESSGTPFEDVVEMFRMSARDLSWAIADLLEAEGRTFLDTTPNLNEDNSRRVKWLFDNDAYELPNHERPRCHQDGHTYPSVYGRLHWDEPAPTITGGFLTPGRGRFVHPLRQRVLTPHEAARVQGFPDWFDFQALGGSEQKRSNLAKWIGDAVPSILGATAIASALL